MIIVSDSALDYAQNLSSPLDLVVTWGFKTQAQALAFLMDKDDEQCLANQCPISWGTETDSGDSVQWEGLELSQAKSIHIHAVEAKKAWCLELRFEVGAPCDWVEDVSELKEVLAPENFWVSPLPYEGKGHVPALDNYTFYLSGTSLTHM